MQMRGHVKIYRRSLHVGDSSQCRLLECVRISATGPHKRLADARQGIPLCHAASLNCTRGEALERAAHPIRRGIQGWSNCIGVQAQYDR